MAGIIETGAARPEDLDAMLALMCEAFDLPLAPAHEVFYKDPYYDVNNKRVLRVDGQVVSCLTVVEARFWIGEAIVPIAGIAGVATRSTHRRQGYAARLLTETLRELAQRGFALSGLVPISYDYYRSFGWELAGEAYCCRVPPARLHPFPESNWVRSATLDDIPRIRQLYEAYAHGRTLHGLRDDKRWKYLMDHVRYFRVVQRPGHAVEGYLLYELRARPLMESGEQGGDVRSPHVRVVEMFAETAEARRALIGHLANHHAVTHIEYTTTLEDLTESGLVTTLRFGGETEAAAHIEIVPTVMIKVIDFRGILSKLSVAWPPFQGALEARMTGSDTVAVQSVRLDGNDQGVVVSAQTSPFPDDPEDNVLEGSPGAWAQLLMGFYSAEDAFALGLLKASSDRVRAVATLLFPARHPFLPAADHF